MADVSVINIDGEERNIKDATARTDITSLDRRLTQLNNSLTSVTQINFSFMSGFTSSIGKSVFYNFATKRMIFSSVGAGYSSSTIPPGVHFADVATPSGFSIGPWGTVINAVARNPVTGVFVTAPLILFNDSSLYTTSILPDGYNEIRILNQSIFSFPG